MTTATQPSDWQAAADPNDLPNGVYYRMPRETYDRIDAANQSTLKEMLGRTPAHARKARLFPAAETDALILGTATHTLFLDGDDVYAQAYAVWKGKARRGKEWEAFKADNADKIILTQAQEDAARLMALSLRENATAARIFARGSETEATIIWDEHIAGSGPLRCKARVDSLTADDWPTVADIKTAATLQTESLQRNVVNFGYHVQGAMYRRAAASIGLGDANFVLCFLETGGQAAYPKPTIVNAQGEPRHAVRVMELDDKAIELGNALLDNALRLYQMAQKTGKWPSFSDEIESLGVPGWALRQQ